MTLRYTYMKPSNGTSSPSRAKKRNEDIFPLWKGMKSRVGDDMMQKMPFSLLSDTEKKVSAPK